MSWKRSAVFPICFLTLSLVCSSGFGQGGFAEADANGNGKVEFAELKTYVSGKMQDFDRFKELSEELDADKDGAISEDEFERRMEAIQAVMEREPPKMDRENRPRGRRNNRRPGRNRRARKPGLKVGQAAPTFKLNSLDKKSETDLADFKGKKPVVLIFGSYT